MTAWTVCLLTILAGAPATVDREALLAGVQEVIAPGCIPAPLVVAGDEAFAVLAGQSARQPCAIVAAARYGQGRVVAIGHEGLFNDAALARADNVALLRNALAWLANGKPQPRLLRVGNFIPPARLEAAGCQVNQAAAGEVQQRLSGVDLVAVSSAEFSQTPAPAVIEVLAAWVKAGGGLLIGGCSWGWQQLNPARDLRTDMGGNRLAARMGLVWTDQMADKTGREGWTAEGDLTLVNASAALTRLEAGNLSDAENARVGATLSLALRSLPAGDPFVSARLDALLEKNQVAAVPTEKTPVTNKSPFGRLAVIRDQAVIDRQTVDQVTAHPAAADFPGAVPAEAPRVTRRVSLDTAIPQWHGTGLYAAPGEIITVQLPAEAVNKLDLRIGCHSDRLWHLESWKRFPQIALQERLKQAETRLASPFGGLIYIVVPGNAKLGRLEVTIAGAVEAPRYVLGQTTLEQWRISREQPAPWAELECAKVVLSVPAQHVRQLEDPDKLMELWVEVLDAQADLAQIPRARTRPERIVADRQISAGYMHSGYPIMTHLDAAPRMASLTTMRQGEWGLFHELGHNHQDRAWTFDGTGEVTCNWFSLYCFEKIAGKAVKDNRGFDAQTTERLKKYLADGAPYDRWKSDPFLALRMYAQLQVEFGWDAFKQVVAGYRQTPADKLPRTDDEKRDQWLVRFSRQVGRNLGPFFEAWGVPTSQAARDSLKDLPTWLPEEMQRG